MHWGTFGTCTVQAKGPALALVPFKFVACVRANDQTHVRDTTHPHQTTQHHTGGDRLRPISTSANSISANFWMLNFGTTKCGALEVGPQRGGGPNLEKVGPRRVGGPKISLFFSHPPATIFFLLSLSLCVEFWWCLKRRGSQNVNVWSSWVVKPRRGRRGFTRQPESPNVHISGFRPSETPTKFLERNEIVMSREIFWVDSSERRAEAAERKVMLGEVSRAR